MLLSQLDQAIPLSHTLGKSPWIRSGPMLPFMSMHRYVQPRTTSCCTLAWLAASIAPEVKAKAVIYHQDYHIGQNPIGMAFLKILTQEAHINIRAMVMYIRAKLSALDSYILTIGCNSPSSMPMSRT